MNSIAALAKATVNFEKRAALLKIAADPNLSPREKLAAVGLIGKGLAAGAKYLPKAMRWMGLGAKGAAKKPPLSPSGGALNQGGRRGSSPIKLPKPPLSPSGGALTQGGRRGSSPIKLPSVPKPQARWQTGNIGPAPVPKPQVPSVPKPQVSSPPKPQVSSVSQPVAPKKFSKEWVAAKTKQDQQYADQFWAPYASKPPAARQDIEQVMNRIIEDSVTKNGGKLWMMTGLGKKESMNLLPKMSAYRLMAQKMGYRVGEFKFNAQSGTAYAKILPPLAK